MTFQPADSHSFEALRRRLAADLRERTVIDSGGRVSHMVWIPKFVVPQGLIKSGEDDEWPSADLDLGGFFIDKYLCSKDDATHADAGSGTVAVSVPGVVPWTDIDQADAATAIDNREVNGVACRLPNLEEWAAISAIGLILGIEVKGNVSAGRDARDPDSPESYAVADPNEAGRTLTGTGPSSWSINGLASGPTDCLGNVFEWLEELVPYCRLTIKSGALLDDAGGIALSDLQLTMDQVDEIDMWPATDGVFEMEDAGNPGTWEIIKYATLADNLDGTYTLGGLTRGHRGTTAVNHADDRPIRLLGEYCVAPEAVTFFVTGLNNTTDPVTFTRHDPVASPTKSSDDVEIGDVIQCESEQLLVTNVVGDQVTADRGHNSTTPASHSDWTPAATHPETVPKVGTEADPTFLRYFDSFQADGAELEAIMMPATHSATPGGAEAGSQFNVRIRGGGFVRGGYHGSGAHVESPHEMMILADTAAFAFIGFRGVLPVED
jgi:hypothetical protein